MFYHPSEATNAYENDRCATRVYFIKDAEVSQVCSYSWARYHDHQGEEDNMYGFVGWEVVLYCILKIIMMFVSLATCVLVNNWEATCILNVFYVHNV